MSRSIGERAVSAVPEPGIGADPVIEATATAPARWTTMQWVAIARLIATMVVPLVVVIVGGAWWLAAYKTKLEIDAATTAKRIEATEKALAGLAELPVQLAVLTTRFDTWAEAVGLPGPTTPRKAAAAAKGAP